MPAPMSVIQVLLILRHMSNILYYLKLLLRLLRALGQMCSKAEWGITHFIIIPLGFTFDWE